MAKEHIPNDPYRSDFSDDDIGRRSNLDDPLRFDPDVAGGPSDGAKIGLVAIALALLMGAVFYGVSHTPVNEAGTTPSTETARNQSGLPPAPPGMRDVTPRRSNTEPGMTTGAAPDRPAAPAAQPSTSSNANPPPAQNNDQH
jgi:hypothetical protein